jgi:homoserine kinase
VNPRVRVFCPATVANWGPGFDVLGVAVRGLGDQVLAEVVPGEPGVELAAIRGDGGRLPREPERNTASVAAASVARRFGIRLRLELDKGLPLSSGLGSSAASSVAGAAAAWLAAGQPLEADLAGLLEHALDGEQLASGARHADNAAPALYGGAILVHSPFESPPGLKPLPLPPRLWMTLVLPELELDTKTARQALPQEIPLREAVRGWGRLGGLIAAFYTGDLDLLSRCLVDDLVEPVRGRLIPGFAAVKAAALQAGALACSISGAGPAVFALSQSQSAAQALGQAMQRAWQEAGVASRVVVTQPDREGVRSLPLEL